MFRIKLSTFKNKKKTLKYSTNLNWLNHSIFAFINSYISQIFRSLKICFKKQDVKIHMRTKLKYVIFFHKAKNKSSQEN